MRFAEADDTAATLIEAYGPDGIVVGGRRYTGGLIVASQHIGAPWGPARPTGLALTHLEALLSLDPQVIVLGTGRAQIFPDPVVYAAVFQRGIGIEFMDTGAACRTYNILISEGRQVVAGLLPY